MKFFLRLLLLIAVSFIVWTCISGPKGVLKKAEKATFIIYAFDEYGSPMGSGSGFFVDKNGHGITNCHVLDKCKKALVRMKDGREYLVDSILCYDETWDIAYFSLKKTNNDNFNYLKICSDKVEQGDKVYNLAAPLGLEQTFSDGLVSSIRKDEHGTIIQVTVPISPGSSGSPIMNSNGRVVAVATFKQTRGENLNFGVSITPRRLDSLISKKRTRSLMNLADGERFVLINTPADADRNLILNAVEFSNYETIAYLTYTNLDMSESSSVIWTTIGEKDSGYYLTDSEGKRHYIISSTIGNSHSNGTSVPLASVCKFKLFFPPVKKDLTTKIDICEGNNRSWSFTNLDINGFRDNINIDFKSYQIERAYYYMHESEFDYAKTLLSGILEEDPHNIKALNALGIISYVNDNNQDAIDYFSEVIEAHPTSVDGYINRSIVYRYQEDYRKSLDDINQVINIGGARMEYFRERSDIYFKLKMYDNAISDLNKSLELDDGTSTCSLYYSRGCCYLGKDNLNLAVKDFKTSLKYAKTSEQRESILSFLNLIIGDSNATSEGIMLSGYVGTYAITMYLRNGEERGSVVGWYFYDYKGFENKLYLAGELKDNYLYLYEFDNNLELTGGFGGNYYSGTYSGEFYSKTSSRKYDFSVSTN